MMADKLTADEHLALGRRFNLADAHTHQAPTKAEQTDVLRNLGQLFEDARKTSQASADRRGLRAFLTLCGQESALDGWFLPTYSASVALEIVANVLRTQQATVGLVEPTFDNIADTLKRHGIALQPIDISDASVPYLEAIQGAVTQSPSIDTLVVVNPNNPTGSVLTRDAFNRLCALCLERRIRLVVDASFRLFERGAIFDHHEALLSSGVEFITIEDTGKVWATLDLKLAYILASPSLRALLSDVHNDILLNVSPFLSLLIEAYSELYLSSGLAPLWSLIARNRLELRRAIRASLLPVTLPYVESHVSVEVLKLCSDISARSLADKMEREGIAILSGESFYWSDPFKGSKYIRVALSRSPSLFREAVAVMVQNWPEST